MALVGGITAFGRLAAADELSDRAILQPRMVERSLTIPVREANDIAFTRIGSTRGMSQSRVSQILQDDQGFMWFGTQYGLNRYDGYTFKVFTHDPLREDSLGGADIRALFKDRAGHLWIACDQRLDRFDPVTEAFVHYRIRAPGEAENATINSISEDASGVLWLATLSGIVSFDPKTGNTANFRHDANNPHSLASDAIKFAAEDRAGQFWVANNSGLEEFSRKDGRVVQRVPLPEMRELSFFEDRSGTFWIFHASGSGLATFDRTTKTLTHYTFDDHSEPHGRHVAIDAIIEDRSGVLWFATAGYGLLKLDRDRRQFTRYRNHAADPQSLAIDNLIALFGDRDGNVWVALHGMRVNVFASQALPFQKLAFEPLTPQTEGRTMVNAIMETAGGNLWLSYLGLLARVDRPSGRRESFPAATKGSTADVLTMVEDRQGATWFGTSGGGIARLARDGTWRYFRHDGHDPSSLSYDVVTRLLIDRHGGLWAATWYGLNRYDSQTGRFQNYIADGAIAANGYSTVAEDANGILWLGTGHYGLERFDAATGAVTHYLHEDDQPDALSNNKVNAVFVDHSGEVWVGTQSGLNLLNRTTGQFTKFYETDGLGGNLVSCILEDQFGIMWISTNNGISRFDPKSKHFDNYSVADGLPGPDMSGWGSCFQGPRGEMFFSGYAGATAFFPNQVVEQAQKPDIVFTEFDLAGVPARSGSHSPIRKAINFTDEVTLSHEDNSFAVAFTALTFRGAESNRYRYRLAGLDAAWHLVGSDRRLASFTTLPAGNYQLMVAGATSRGPWSEPAILRIHILEPWWDTWWFISSVTAAVALLLSTAYFLRLSQLKVRIRERLELRHAERERIARELHDTLLQGIQAILFRLQAWGKQSAIPLEHRNEISTVATQARAIVVEGRDRILDLRRTIIAQADLVEALQAVAGTEGAGSDAVFSISVMGEEQALIPEAYEQVLEITREGIRNAYRHAAASNISVTIEYQSAWLRIVIIDDGRGIDDSMLKQAGHFGMIGMRERAAQLRATFIVGKGAKRGVVLTLSVPAEIVYVEAHRAPWLRK